MSSDWRRLLAALVVVDSACLLASALAATWIHQALAHRSPGGLWFPVALTVGTGVVALAAVHAYDRENLMAGTREYSAVVRACVYGLVAVSLLSFTAQHPVSRAWIGISWVVAAILLVGSRYAVRRLARALHGRGRFARPTLVVGADANAVALAQRLDMHRTGMQVVGFLDDYHPIGTVLLPGVRVVGRTSSLRQVALRGGVRDAIVVPQALPWETLNHVITAVAVAPDAPQIHLSAGFYDLLTTRVRLSSSHDVPLLTVAKASLSRRQSLVKAALDQVVAAELLTLLSPAIAVMVVWQRLRGNGQLLQRRSVAGRAGQVFDLLSFRSSAPFESALLRKLPGLVNVLRGELSIVGPHPLDAGNVTPRPVLNAGLRPGLTGPWRDVDDPAEQAVRDLYYVRAYSVSLDVQVLFARVRSRFRRARRGAAPELAVERAR